MNNEVLIKEKQRLAKALEHSTEMRNRLKERIDREYELRQKLVEQRDNLKRKLNKITLNQSNSIQLVLPNGIYENERPTIKWNCTGDWDDASVDIVIQNLKSAHIIKHKNIRARDGEFTLPDPLNEGYYTIKIRNTRYINVNSNMQRIAVVDVDDRDSRENEYLGRNKVFTKPDALNKTLTPDEKNILFSWECDNPNILSFNLFMHDDSEKKVLKTWKGIDSRTNSFKVPIEEIKDLSPGEYRFVVQVVYFEKNLSSNPITYKHEITHVETCSDTKKNKRENIVIRLDEVGINFKKASSGKQKKIGRSFSSVFKKGGKIIQFWALRNVTFSLSEGEILGVIGNNGAGKSTLLKILTGVLIPDEGEIALTGKVSSLLSLGAGFMPDLSGRENIYLNGTYMGLDQETLHKKYDQIVKFAELDNFIETQVKYYSSGMKARLGFSVAVHIDPEILIVDEVLAAGDKNFRKKAERKMKEFMSRAKAIVIASHSPGTIKGLCDKCIWLEHGKVRGFGPAVDIVEEYMSS
jgi:ABC-type polysaccharide/polyol phosphate transport system ATPase subunit